MSNSHQCVHCGQTFSTQRGLSLHRSRHCAFSSASNVTSPPIRDDHDRSAINDHDDDDIVDCQPGSNDHGSLCEENSISGTSRSTFNHGILFNTNEQEYAMHGPLSELFERMQENLQSSRSIPAELQVHVGLLNILKKGQAPLYLFEEICCHFRNVYHRAPFIFSQPPTARDSVLKSLYRRYAYEGLQPKESIISLSPGRQLSVTTHSFLSSLFSLLTDETIMLPNNLLFDVNDPSTPYYGSPDAISDLNSGELYKMGWENFCQPGTNDMLCGLIFFIDKTHTDVQGKLTVEPVTFTLSIFKRSLRNQTHAWRTIGYIPNQDLLGGKSAPLKKIQDYHHILGHIFKEIYDLQQGPGIPWEFSFNGTSHLVNLKIPAMLFLGDTEGQDKLVGRFTNRSSNVNRLCRYCDCPTDETDDPDVRFAYLQQKTVIGLMRRRDSAGLRSLSHHDLTFNAVHKLQFCDGVRGIHGATPFEVVHTIQLGWHVYAINAFFRFKRQYAKVAKEVSKKDKEISKKQRTNSGAASSKKEVYKAKNSIRSQLNVFGPEYSVDFEELAKYYGRSLQAQSDRDLPRTFFAQGIIPSDDKKKRNRKKFAAHEYQGCILVILFILCSEEWVTVQKRMGRQAASAYLDLFEQCILLENFLQTEYVRRSDVEMVREYVPLLMDMFKRTIDRQEGMGSKFVKFHFLTHLADDVLRNGVSQNTTSGPGESRHKELCKQPARHTQRRANVFDNQLGKQYADNLLLSRAQREINNSSLRTNQGIANTVAPHATQNVAVNSFLFRFQNGQIGYDQKRWQAFPEWENETLQDDLLDFFVSTLSRHTISEHCDCFSILKKDGYLYRAHPFYQPRREWRDWALVDFGPVLGYVPARLICFVSMTGFVGVYHGAGDHQLSEDGYYALVHKIPVSLDDKPLPSWVEEYGDNHKAHQASVLFQYSRLEMRNVNRRKVPAIYMVPLCAILSPQIGVRDISNTKQKHSYIFLRRRSLWQDIFFDLMQQKLQELPDDSIDRLSDSGCHSSSSGSDDDDDRSDDTQESQESDCADTTSHDE